MVEPNLISLYLSWGILILGILAFLFSNLKLKYLTSSVILAIGLRLAYWVYLEMESFLSPFWMVCLLGAFLIGIIGSSISILFSVPAKEDLK